MTTSILRSFSCLFVVAVALTAVPAGAQPVTVLSIDFEFSNPGARSLGFGGAFAALADDATAAYANPAGLGQLVEQEVSVEVRSWSRSVPYLSAGRLSGEPTGIGLDTIAGVVEDTAGQDVTDLSFVSYVRPVGRWSLALFHHQLARLAIDTQAQGPFLQLFGTSGRFPATREQLELDLTATGGAVSWKATETLSLGVGLSLIDGTATARSEIYFPFDGTAESLFRPVSFSDDELVAVQDLEVDGSTLAARLGVLWQPSEPWSVAAFFRQGGSLDGERRERLRTGDGDFVTTRETELNVPDVFGIGVAYRALDGQLTLAAEADRIEGEPLFPNEETTNERGSWEEIHLGAEYAWVAGRRLLALRTGTWYDSRAQGLTEDEGTLHYALGFGIASGAWQLDLGADFSDLVDTVSLSTIYKF